MGRGHPPPAQQAETITSLPRETQTSRQSLLPCPSLQQLEPGWRQAWRQPRCPGKLGPPTGLRTKLRGAWGSVLRHPLLPRPLQLGLGWGTWAGDPDGLGHRLLQGPDCQRSQQFCSGGARGGAGKAGGRGTSILLAYFSFMCFDAHPDRDPLGAGHSPRCWGHSGGPHSLSSAC